MAAFGLGVALVAMRYTVRTPFLSPDTMPPEIQIQREIDCPCFVTKMLAGFPKRKTTLTRRRMGSAMKPSSPVPTARS
jgi:hypothetical protein